jgi:hypothetical protein
MAAPETMAPLVLVHFDYDIRCRGRNPQGTEEGARMNANEATPKRQPPRPPDELDRIFQENEEKAKANGWVFTRPPTLDPESRKLLVRIIKEMVGM